MANGRLQYLDSLKGVAIFMVVMGHVITYGIYKIDSSIVFRLIGLIHMPLFFFMSGYFTVRNGGGEGLHSPNLWKRFCQLIVPMVLVSTLWIFYYPHSGLPKYLDCTFSGLWGNLWKNGYWFTPVLFLIMLFYWIVAKMDSLWRGKAWTYICCLIIYGLMCIVLLYLPEDISNLTGLPFVVKYFPVFMFGGWMRVRGERFMSAPLQGSAYSVALVVSIVMAAFILFPDSFGMHGMSSGIPWRDIAQVIFHCSLAIVAVGVFWDIWREPPAKGTFRSGVMSLSAFAGRRSLAIYLMHYFFLFPVEFLRGWMSGMNLGFVPVAFTAATCAVLIMAVCLGVDSILRKSWLMSFLLLGDSLPLRKR